MKAGDPARRRVVTANASLRCTHDAPTYRLAASLAVLLTPGLAAHAQTPYDTAKSAQQQRTGTERRAAAGDADRRVWDFVIADRKNGTVTLLACATTIQPTDPVEFFVNPLTSGKDYESLAVTFATPADIAEALRFVGLTPGESVDPKRQRFWARGPRVLMTFAWGGRAPLRAETLVTDTATQKPLAPAGLIYTDGSRMTDPRTTPVDAESASIAPTYNEPAALFDVTYQGLQGEVYGRRRPSPAFTVKAGDLIDITLAAGVGNDAVPQTNVEVLVEVEAGRTTYAFVPHPRDGQPMPPGGRFKTNALPDFLAELSTRADGKADLFVQFGLSNAVLVTDLRNLFAVLRAVEKDRGVKLDAPGGSELFHRSFFPDPVWRDRVGRLGEPWELFLSRDAAGAVRARLERQTDDPNATPRQVIETTQPADPRALAAYLRTHASRWSQTLFVYPPPDLTYGELCHWAHPVETGIPNIYVFPPDPAAASATTMPAAEGR